MNRLAKIVRNNNGAHGHLQEKGIKGLRKGPRPKLQELARNAVWPWRLGRGRGAQNSLKHAPGRNLMRRDIPQLLSNMTADHDTGRQGPPPHNEYPPPPQQSTQSSDCWPPWRPNQGSHRVVPPPGGHDWLCACCDWSLKEAASVTSRTGKLAA